MNERLVYFDMDVMKETFDIWSGSFSILHDYEFTPNNMHHPPMFCILF